MTSTHIGLQWMCSCKHIYNSSLDAVLGCTKAKRPCKASAGTSFSDLPEDWVCPICEHSKNAYNLLYLGSRGSDFKTIITNILKKGRLKPKYIELLTNKESMEAYARAFTASTVDIENNYERFEQIGDVTANKFIVWYAYRRFPQLDCTDGVKVVARLRINYGAKQFFATLGESLGFWPFISAAESGVERNKYYRVRDKKDLLEDVLEAFVGCTEYLLDNAFRSGVGYGIVYDILADIFDEIPMSLVYEDLYDPKTRLKESFDANKSILGEWAYIESSLVIDTTLVIKSQVYRIPPGINKKPTVIMTETGPVQIPKPRWELIGEGISRTKADAQQKAATAGIENLKSKGYYKEAPKEYEFFCKK